MDNFPELSPVQATGYGTGESKSPTELARWVAKENGWLIHNGGTIHDENGDLLAYSIEDLAEAGEELDWYSFENTGINQSAMMRSKPGALKARVKAILGAPDTRP